VLANTSAPVINPPAAVLATGRCDIAHRLAHIPGVISANTTTVPREQLLASDAGTTLNHRGFTFPLLLRTPGFHGGEHFLRVDTIDDLSSAVEQLPKDNLFVIEYLDARGPDGNSRKYRVMMIDGHLYPLHVAISSNWKIHYYTADMADHPQHRFEDAAFLEDMPAVLGTRAMAALQQIQNTLGLDYGGIDFGLNERGDVLLFEANATMAVIVPDKDQRWDYRRPATERIYTAVWKMLMSRAKAAVVECGDSTRREK
jgi:glutathione synthase/RimK-type ligase-like ATP-grasp enzyme